MNKRTKEYYMRMFLSRARRQLVLTEEVVQDLLRIYELTWLDIEKYIRENYLTLQDESAKVLSLNRSVNNSYGALNQLTIFQTVQEQIKQETLKLLKSQNEIVVDYMQTTIKDSYLHDVYTYRAMAENSSTFFYNQRIVNNIMSRKWFGGNYYSRSVLNNERLAAVLDEVLLRGSLQGFPLEHMVDELRKKFIMEKKRARTLVYSEVGYVQEQANYEAMTDSNLEKYMFLATLEIHTCGECQDLDGKEFFLRDAQVGYNYPLIHGHCRCTAIGIVKDAPPIKMRWYRDPVTGKGKIGAWMTYKEWFKQHVVGAD